MKHKIAQDKGQDDGKKNDSWLTVHLNREQVDLLLRLIMVLIVTYSQRG